MVNKLLDNCSFGEMVISNLHIIFCNNTILGYYSLLDDINDVLKRNKVYS